MLDVFRGRVTELRILDKKFTYIETAEFLDGYTNEDKAICYGLTNGVAKYIEQFDASESLEQNIIEQFYPVGGYYYGRSCR